jgi:outer membrane protein
MRRIIIFALLISGHLLFAEKTVSLQEVINAALENNDDLKAAEYEKKSTSWEKYSSLTSFLPTASYSSTILQIDPKPVYVDDFGVPHDLDDTQRTNTAQVVLPILTGGKRIVGFFIAKRLEQIAKNDFAATELDTRSSAELKFLTLIESNSLQQIADQDLQSAAKNLEIAQIKFDTGVVSEADLLQMQSEHASKEASFIDAELYYRISSTDLANFCNFEDQILIPTEISYQNPIERVFEKCDPIEISQLLEGRCTERNLTLKTMEQNLSLGRWSKIMAITNNLPSLNLIYERNWTDDYDLNDDKDESSSLMLSASVPLLPFADTFCNYKKEHYQYKKTQLQYSSVEKGVKLQLTSSVLTLAGSVKKLKSSELALQYAERTLLQMEERYKNNIVSANELLSVSLMKQSSEIAVLQNQISLIKSKSELKKLLNIKTDEELLQMIITN